MKHGILWKSIITQIHQDLDLPEPEEANKIALKNKPKYEKKRIHLYKTKQLEDDNTKNPLLKNLVRKCQECRREDLVNTYNKDLQQLYNQVVQVKTKEVL